MTEPSIQIIYCLTQINVSFKIVSDCTRIQKHDCLKEAMVNGKSKKTSNILEIREKLSAQNYQTECMVIGKAFELT